jgi:hypothetical protein
VSETNLDFSPNKCYDLSKFFCTRALVRQGSHPLGTLAKTCFQFSLSLFILVRFSLNIFGCPFPKRDMYPISKSIVTNRLNSCFSSCNLFKDNPWESG